MQLSRDAIQRMFYGTVGGNGQGLSPSELSGLATEQWVDANYVSINYFNRLFQARNGETAVPPNDIRTTIDNIKATVGLWTEQYLSALGLGDGGGGGGAVALIDLVDVAIVSPHTGQALVYNASTGKWVNGDVGAVVSITAGIGLSGGTITSSGTIAINTTYQEYIAHGETAYGWGNHASAGYLTAADAASTYLSKTDAASTYLSKTDAASTYLSKTDAASTYLTIAFFRSLFKAYNSGGSEVVPNGGSVSTIDNIKAMFGFWTDQYLSALGQGSGGGGGAVALTDLVDVAIVSPQTGQVLVYNATTGKWVNGAATAGTVTSITAGTGLSGGTITRSGTIAINTTYQTYIGHGETAYGWGNHANAGYLTGITATMINNALGFTLSGTSGQTYNLTTIKSNAADGETAYGWGNHANAGYLTSSSGLNASNINSGTVGFAYMPTMYWANVAISNESKINTSPQFANIRLQNGSSLYGSYLRFGDGDSLVYLTEDSDDHLKIYGKYGVEVSTSSGYNLTWNGNTVATRTWVNANYLSISFFRSLFRAYNSSDAEVVPNGGDTNTIDSIKAMFGFWTNYYLSALGQNSGGGGGGATALADLTDVAILSPQTGQVLVYNSSTGKWVNGDAGGGATTLSGLTDVAIQSPQTGQVLVYNSSTGKWVNGSGGGTTLNQPLSAINSAGLGTPTQSGVAIMWNGSSWTYQVPGGGGGGGGTVTSVGLSVPTGFGISGSPVTGSGTITISFNSGYALPTTADVNKGVTAYGWGNHANAGYLTAADAASTYLTISFFRSLFKAYNSGGSEVVPNVGSVGTIDNIKAMFGFWTDQYLSALGQGSGGGGGAVALTDLTDVAIQSPQTGQALVYNATTGKWVNGDAGGGGGVTLNQPLSAINSAGLGTPTQSGVAIMWNGSSWTYQVPGGGGGGGGTVTSVGLSVPTGFGISGSPVTGSGTITISFNSGYALPTTADVNKGVTAYGWGNHANAGYLTGINSSMVTSALGYTPLSNTTTFWGQTQSGGVVSGSLSSVGSITMSGDVNMDTGKKIISDSKTLLEYDGSQVSLGYGFRSTVPTQIHGTNVIFYAGGTEKARVTNTGLQIGSAVLVWDSTNNALKVQKSDGTACNLYALGGVSALGFQAGSGGTDSATISSLNTNLITFPDNDNNDCSIKNNDGSLVLDTDGNSGYVKTCDLCSINGSSNWLIGIGGNAFFSDRVRSPKFYVDNTRYIYLDGTTLKYFDGSTSKTIVLQ